MELQQLISDPHAQVAATVAVLGGLSTVHKYLDAHPRAQAAAKLVTGLLGPLNFPGLWAGIVVLARAIVAAEDSNENKVMEAVIAIKGLARAIPAVPQPVPPLVPTAPEKLPFTETNTTNVPAGAVKEWPKQ